MTTAEELRSIITASGVFRHTADSRGEKCPGTTDETQNMFPTIGRIFCYVLNSYQVDNVNKESMAHVNLTSRKSKISPGIFGKISSLQCQ